MAPCVFFNRLGEIAGEYLKKGSKVYVEGSLRTRKWQGQDGSDRYTTEIVASEMQMLDSAVVRKVAVGISSRRHVKTQRHSSRIRLLSQQNQAPQQARFARASASGYAGFDDDIPF